MTRPVILIDIGADCLPEITPVEHIAASWVPVVYVAPLPPEPANLVATSAFDGILLTWDEIDGARFHVSTATAAGGPWNPVAETTDARYFHSEPVDAGAVYFKVVASINGRRGGASFVHASVKPPPGEELRELLEDEIAARYAADALAAEKSAADLLAQALAQQAALDAEREAREQDVAAATARIDAIDDDEIISPGEKPQLRIDFQALLDERPGITEQAELSEVEDELTEYNTRLGELIAYMETLVTPVRWDDTSDFTYLT